MRNANVWRRHRQHRVNCGTSRLILLAAGVLTCIVLIGWLLFRDDYLPAIHDPFVRKDPFPYGSCGDYRQTPEFLAAKARQQQCLVDYRGQVQRDREQLLAARSDLMTPDENRERDDALYFNGVPSYMRKGTVYAQSQRPFVSHPSSVAGNNSNLDPNSLCFALDEHSTNYSELRPHIFSRDAWRNWFKEIGLTEPPVKLKGPSRPQSFGGRVSNVRIVHTVPEEKAARGSQFREIVLDPPGNAESKLTAPSGVGKHKYYDLVVKLASAFAIYDANPRSESVIPAYASACLGKVDCKFIEKHIDVVYEFGVGYFVWTLNTQDKEPHELGELLARAFPSRFVLITADRQLGLSEVWNRYNRMFFHQIDDPLPWFLNANADFWPKNQALEVFFEYMQHKLRTDPNHTLITFGAFSYFVHTYRAYMVLGDYDEVVFPAYCEDTELYLRARSMGLYFQGCTYWANRSDYVHVREVSLTDANVKSMFRRWDSSGYLRDKYNVHARYPNWEYSDETLMFKFPFNLSCVPPRSSFVVDPTHRECILTGRGPFDEEDKCIYHAKSHVNRMKPKSMRV